MALSVTHSTVVVVPDDGTSPVGTNEWNAAHTLSGTVDIANGGTGATTASGAAANLGLGTGDSPQFTTINLGNASDTTLARSAAGVMTVEGIVVAMTGKQCVPVPAVAMTPNTTSGAAAGTAEMTTNKNMVVTLDFGASKSAQFSMAMPNSWDEGPVTFQPVWSHPSTTTNFGTVWELSAVACSDGDALDVAFGTGQTSTDTGGTTNTLYIGPESSAITIAGSPATGDFVMFKITRTGGSLAVDARLHAIKLFLTQAAGNDA